MSISDRSDVRYLPLIRYADVEGSARWLCNALGFQVHMAVRNPEGVMDYVHLVQGGVNVVVKPIEDGGQTHAQTGDDTQSRYVFVHDVARHFEVARAEGAYIDIALQRTPGLGMGYSCRDAEGLIWSFGSFDPWKIANLPSSSEDMASVAPEAVAPANEPEMIPREPVPAIAVPEPHIRRDRQRRPSRSILLALAAGGLAGSIIAAGGLYYGTASGTSVAQQIASEQAQRQRSEAAALKALDALAHERIAKEQFQKVSQRMEAELKSTQLAAAEAQRQALASHGELEAEITELHAEQTGAAAKMSEAEKQWRAVHDSLTGELETAKAAATRAQAERVELETVMTARVFSIERDLKAEQALRKTAEAAKTAAEQQLSDERSGRQRAEAALKTALANLKAEQQSRLDEERRADKLAAQLSARRPASRVARARPAIRAKSAPVRAKQQAAPKTKVMSADTVLDIGFQP